LADRDHWPLKNDFEDVIFEIEPEIKRAKIALLDSGARDALLAGSGSSVFGIFPDEESQQRGLDSLKLETGWRVFLCNTISRAEYFAAFDLPFLRSSDNF
jgi:4-diphosphocytidyl-2-C-methyl-D-erythritol kinase